MLWWLAFALGCLLCLIWISVTPQIVRFYKYRIIDKLKTPEPSSFPMVSVIIPARDEEAKIESCLKSLIAQDYPNFEIIAINDRSSDRTGTLMDTLSQSEPKLTVIHIETLPDSWLGKNHAMHIASKQAKGDFLLFSDGDVEFRHDALRCALSYTLHHNLDHLTLTPRHLPGGYWENAFISFFSLIFLMVFRPLWVSQPTKTAYVGLGSFNLLKASVYRQIGGHANIPLAVLDDIKLGKLVKVNGFRQEILIGANLLRLRWHRGLSGIMRGMEKNAFASLNFSVPALAFSVLANSGFCLLPYFAVVFLEDRSDIGFLGALVMIHALMAFVGQQHGVGWKVTFVFPVMVLVYYWVVIHSAFKTLRHGGVYWRETFYPLKLLRDRQTISSPTDKQEAL